MRVNEPITDKEVEMKDGSMLVSQTDTGGRIVFVNQAFIETSGYSETELIGAPHNIVRHPHMPKEAFADLWRIIKTGQPWEGLVKNRTKRGDFYWVHANVTPVIERGQINGFVSIRTKPTREQIRAADAAYADLRNKRVRGLTVEDGAAVRKTLFYRLSRASSSIAGRLAVLGAVLALAIAALVGFGANDLIGANESIRSLYEDRAVPLQQLGSISDQIRSEFETMQSAAIALAQGKAPQDPEAALTASRQTIDKLWTAYMATYLTPEEAQLAKTFADRQKRLQEVDLPRAAALVKAGDLKALQADLAGAVQTDFTAAQQGVGALIQLQVDVSREIYGGAEASFSSNALIGAGLLGGLVLVLAGSSWWLVRSLNRPIRQFGADFEAIARGDLNHVIRSVPLREFHVMTKALRAMRAKLAYSAEERREYDLKTAEERSTALLTMAATVNKETETAVAAVAALTGGMTEEAREMSSSASTVNASSQTVAAAATEALANAQTVASASEELSASIAEIASQVNVSRTVTGEAVAAANRAQTIIGQLSDAVTKIGQVTGLISEIAGQTNLLALNATIEAARAGEQGRGFAVVASEVKSLANQTANATGDITAQISAVQAATQSAVTAVASIVESIGRVESVSTAIAAAVDEQSATTSEIARNVTQTTVAAQEVAERIGQVALESTQTGTRAERVQSLSGEVSTSVSNLGAAITKVIDNSVRNLDRRRKPRYQFRKGAEVVAAGVKSGMIVENISEGGALLHGPAPDVGVGAPVTVTITGFDFPLPAVVRGRRSERLHVKFELEPDVAARYQRELAVIVRDKTPLGNVA